MTRITLLIALCLYYALLEAEPERLARVRVGFDLPDSASFGSLPLHWSQVNNRAKTLRQLPCVVRRYFIARPGADSNLRPAYTTLMRFVIGKTLLGKRLFI